MAQHMRATLDISVPGHFKVLFDNNPHVHEVYWFPQKEWDEKPKSWNYDWVISAVPYASKEESQGLRNFWSEFLKDSKKSLTSCLQWADEYLRDNHISYITLYLRQIAILLGEQNPEQYVSDFLLKKENQQVIFLSDDEKADATAWKAQEFEQRNIDKSTMVVWVALGAVDPHRNYHQRGDVVKWLIAQGYAVILLGDNKATDIQDTIMDSLDYQQQSMVISMAGETKSIRDMISKVWVVDGLIGCDGGIPNVAMGLWTNINNKPIQTVIINSRIRGFMRIPGEFNNIKTKETSCKVGGLSIFKDGTNNPCQGECRTIKWSTQQYCETCMSGINPQDLVGEIHAMLS